MRSTATMFVSTFDVIVTLKWFLISMHYSWILTAQMGPYQPVEGGGDVESVGDDEPDVGGVDGAGADDGEERHGEGDQVAQVLQPHRQPSGGYHARVVTYLKEEICS